jgi:hypothetical protein
MPDKAPLEQDSDQYEEDRQAYDELQEEKTRYLNNQQRRVKRVLDDRNDRGERVHGHFAPFIIAKSREDAEALTGRRALVARFTDLTKYIGDTDEDFEIHQELTAGFRQMQIPIAESSKGSLKIDDVAEGFGTFSPTVAGVTTRWFYNPATMMWCQIVGVPVPAVGELTRIEIFLPVAIVGGPAYLWIGERGYANSVAGVTGLIVDYDNLLFTAGPIAVVAPGVIYDRLTPPDIVYINHDDEPSLIAGARTNNAGFKNGTLWVMIGILGLAPPPGLGPDVTLRVKITTKEAV